MGDINLVIVAHYIVIACALLLASCSQQDEQQQVTDSILERAQSYFEQGQYKAALIETKNVLAAREYSPEAVLLTAKIYLLLGNVTAVAELLVPLIEENNDLSIEYGLVLADSYIKRNKYRSALNVVNGLAASSDQKLNSQRDLILGLAYAGLGRARESEKWLQRALQSNPRSLPTLMALIQLAASKNDIAVAKTYLEQAANIEPKHSGVLTWQGHFRKSVGDLEGALEYYSDALGNMRQTDLMEYQRILVLNYLSDTFTKLGRPEEAAIYKKVLAEANPQQSSLSVKFAQAKDFYELGEVEKSGALLSDILKSSPNNRQAQAFLGLIKYTQGDFAAAEQLLSSSVDPEVASEQAVRLLASAALKQGHPQKVLDLLEKDLGRYEDSPDILAIYGIAALATQNELSGESAMMMALSLRPKYAGARIALANYYYRQGRTREALKQLDIGLQIEPSSIDINVTLLKFYNRENNVDAFQKTVANLIQLAPDNIEVRNNIAKQFFERRQYADAAGHFSAVLVLEPNNATANLGQAAVLMAQQDWAKAAEYYRNIIRNNPAEINAYKGLFSSYEGLDSSAGRNSATAKRRGIEVLLELAQGADTAYGANAVLAEFYLRASQPELSLDYARAAYDLKPDADYSVTLYATAHFDLALLAFGNEEYIKARSNAKSALEVSANDIRVLELLVRCEIALKRYEQAEQLIDNIRQIYPDALFAELLNGDLLAHQGELQKSLSEFQVVWQSKPTAKVGKKILGLLKSMDENEAAIKFSQDWMEQFPQALAPRLFLALAFHAAGDKVKAIEQYEGYAAIDPDNGIVMNNLAWLYFETGHSGALSTAARAYELMPENGAIADTYGWILVNSAEVERGVEILEMALQLAPDSEEIKRHLELAFNKLNGLEPLAGPRVQ